MLFVSAASNLHLLVSIGGVDYASDGIVSDDLDGPMAAAKSTCDNALIDSMDVDDHLDEDYEADSGVDGIRRDR